MSIVIHDIKIKNLIRTFQFGENQIKKEEAYSDILNLISEFIYNFPRIKFHKDKDVCSEFYLYTINHLPKIISKFNIKGNASFQTWFAVVLVNLWKNFNKLSQNKEEKINTFKTESLDNPNTVVREDLLRQTVVYKSNEENENNNEKSSIYIDQIEIKSFESCFEKMPKKVRIVIKAHFFELFTSFDIEEAVEVFQLDFMDTLRKYEVMVVKTREQYQKLSEIIDEINNIVYELNNLEHQKKLTENDIIEQNKYSNKIKRLETLKTKKIDELKSMYIKLTPKEIADFFNTNANSISNLLHRGKNYIKDYFKPE